MQPDVISTEPRKATAGKRLEGSLGRPGYFSLIYLNPQKATTYPTCRERGPGRGRLRPGGRTRWLSKQCRPESHRLWWGTMREPLRVLTEKGPEQ